MHVADLHYFFGPRGPYYRSESLSLSRELLLFWFEMLTLDRQTLAVIQTNDQDSKLLSLLCIRLDEKMMKESTVNHTLWNVYFLEKILELLSSLARVNPSSHAYSRYMGLGAEIVQRFEGDQRIKTRATLVQGFILAMRTILSPQADKSGFSEVKMLLSYFLSGDFFTKEEKVVVKTALDSEVKKIASEFFFFMDDVQCD